MEQAAGEIKDLHTELFKCKTALKHRDIELTEQLTAKQLQMEMMEKNLKGKHTSDMQELAKHNSSVLTQQQGVIAKAPDTFKTYSTLRANYSAAQTR